MYIGRLPEYRQPTFERGGLFSLCCSLTLQPGYKANITTIPMQNRKLVKLLSHHLHDLCSFLRDFAPEFQCNYCPIISGAVAV